LQPTMFQWNLLQPLCNKRSHWHWGFWLDLMFHQLVHQIPSMPLTVLNPRQVIQESTLREPTKCALKVAPWQVNFECSFKSVWQCNFYNNHPGLDLEIDNVRAKLAKEEAQSFHVALPQFLWHFLPGIHIALMVWAWQKGKGCLCVDPSSRISSTNDGAPNDSIPPPGLDGHEDECPSIYYSTALHWHLTQIWNLCIMYPNEDIL
jgi:hypothetical protein